MPFSLFKTLEYQENDNMTSSLVECYDASSISSFSKEERKCNHIIFSKQMLLQQALARNRIANPSIICQERWWIVIKKPNINTETAAFDFHMNESLNYGCVWSFINEKDLNCLWAHSWGRWKLLICEAIFIFGGFSWGHSWFFGNCEFCHCLVPAKVQKVVSKPPKCSNYSIVCFLIWMEKKDSKVALKRSVCSNIIISFEKV